MKKIAVITGITGQDGSYLAELLLSKSYTVIGAYRRTSSPNFGRISHLLNSNNLIMESCDLTDLSSLVRIVDKHKPDEFYNLAAQSFVKISFNQPILTAGVTGIGVLNCLEALMMVKPNTRFYQAGSSEMYGKVHEIPQSIHTPFHPRSPYGVAKVFGHYITINYREAYGMFACSGILHNHESSRRGEEFVTRKISLAVSRIKKGLQKKLYLGNLDAKRDWGYAKDYVEAMWMMLQQETPNDYVVGTGETYSVREFCDEAFSYVGLNYKDYVIEDKELFRPAEVDILLADIRETTEKLKWKPKTKFKDLVKIMVDHDMSSHIG